MEPAAILYYFPRVPKQGAGSMFAANLNWIPEDLRPRFRTRTVRQPARGPDNKTGCLITWQEHVKVEYGPQRQSWRKCGAYWIGARKGYEPAEFAKFDAKGNIVAPGYSILLGDGREYIVPVALADMPNCRIPWRETLSPTGDLVRETDPAYREVCAVAQELYDHITEDDAFQMDEDRLRRACAVAVSVNYNLTLTECLALGLFTSESYQRIIGAILDLPAVTDILKKKAAEAMSTDSGEADGSDATNLPTPTSPSSP